MKRKMAAKKVLSLRPFQGVYMRIGKYCILNILLFGLALVAYAQREDSVRWSGNVQFRGASNFGPASDAAFSAGLQRETSKLSASLDFSVNRSSSLREKNVTYSSENIHFGHKENSRNESRGLGEKIRFGVRYTPRSSDVFHLHFTQSYTRSNQNDTLRSQKIGAASGRAVLLAEGSNFESAERKQKSYQFDADYVHRIDADRRSFHAELFLKNNLNEQINVRKLDGSLYTPLIYRITPAYENRTSSMKLFYRDAKFMDVTSLKFSAGMDLRWGMSNDGYGGATLVDGSWRDSLLLKQKYLYRSAAAEPYATVSYHYKIFDFFAEERFQYYNHKLWSNLNGWDWDKSDLFHSAKLQVKCRPSGRHHLQLELERSLSRPNYLMLSGLLRSGSSPQVYYLGNAGLKPTKNYRMDLQYMLDVRSWQYGVQAGYRLMKNVAEQVLYSHQENIPAPLREKLRDVVVYSWLNTAYKDNYHLKLSVRWKTDEYAFNAWSVLNYDVNRYASSSSTDFNSTMGCEGSWRFHERWKLSMYNTFDSRRREVYTHTSAYLSSKLRLDYTCRKLHCYAEITELFDRPIKRTTYSENFDYWRTESTRYYRRMMVIGAQWRV